MYPILVDRTQCSDPHYFKITINRPIMFVIRMSSSGTYRVLLIIFYLPSLSSPKFPQPIFLPTRKFGPTMSTLELADDDKPCRPATAECIALDPVDFPPRLSSLPFCSFSRSLFCMAPI